MNPIMKYPTIQLLMYHLYILKRLHKKTTTIKNQLITLVSPYDVYAMRAESFSFHATF